MSRWEGKHVGCLICILQVQVACFWKLSKYTCSFEIICLKASSHIQKALSDLQFRCITILFILLVIIWDRSISDYCFRQKVSFHRWSFLNFHFFECVNLLDGLFKDSAAQVSDVFFSSFLRSIIGSLFADSGIGGITRRNVKVSRFSNRCRK